MYMQETRGESIVTNQEVIELLQVAISKLDQIIADMSANCEPDAKGLAL